MLVSFATFFVLLNGSLTPFFQASYGLRQWELLSTILFILMATCLGRFVEKMVQKREFVGLRPKHLTYSHQQFVDDSIVMGESLVKNVKNIKKDLEDYKQAT